MERGTKKMSEEIKAKVDGIIRSPDLRMESW